MVSAVDDSGELASKLDELNLSDNTVIIFFSDNGGLSTKPKWDRGVTHLFVQAKAGFMKEEYGAHNYSGTGYYQSWEYFKPTNYLDGLFPTIAELADFKPKLHADGRSLLPELTEKGETRPFYWHYPHYHGSTWTPSIHSHGDWKLIKFYDYEKIELYNLKNDPSESKDYQGKSQNCKRSENKLVVWQKSMKAKLQKPNPDYEN